MPSSSVLADGSPEGKVGGNQCLPQGFLLMDHQKERSEEINAFLRVLADGSPEGKVGGNQCLPQGFLLMDH